MSGVLDLGRHGAEAEHGGAERLAPRLEVGNWSKEAAAGDSSTTASSPFAPAVGRVTGGGGDGGGDVAAER